MSFLDKLYKKNATSIVPESKDSAANEKFELFRKEFIESEKKKMDAMSRIELIEYQAETRFNAVYASLMLQEAVEALGGLKGVQVITIETLNKVIENHVVKPIDISKL